MFEYDGAYPFLAFYLANSPWLVGYGWLAWDAFTELLKRPDDHPGSQSREVAGDPP